MIKTKAKTYADANNPLRIITTEVLSGTKLLKANASRQIVREMSTKAGIFYTDANGNGQFLPLPTDAANRVLVTNQNGNLDWKKIGG